MGGYGSGGHNRKHGYTDRYKKLDSFNWAEVIPLMELKSREGMESSLSWTDGSSIGIVLYTNHLHVVYSVGNGADKRVIRDDILFDKVSNNYGGRERIYFLCSYCCRRSRFLYLHIHNFKCRKCASLNYQSQQLTKNDDIPIYKMRKLLRDKFKVKENLAPIDMECYRPKRPKGMRETTYLKLRIELIRLQNEYYDQFIRKVGRVVGML